MWNRKFDSCFLSWSEWTIKGLISQTTSKYFGDLWIDVECSPHDCLWRQTNINDTKMKHNNNIYTSSLRVVIYFLPCFLNYKDNIDTKLNKRKKIIRKHFTKYTQRVGMSCYITQWPFAAAYHINCDNLLKCQRTE